MTPFSVRRRESSFKPALVALFDYHPCDEDSRLSERGNLVATLSPLGVDHEYVIPVDRAAPMSVTRTTTPERPATEQKPMPLWACGVIGAAAAIVGLLPWLATGARLPVQNLWDAAAPPDSMPIALLPFSQYSLSHLFGLIVTGSALAGIVARATRARLPRGGFAVLLAGALLVQVVAAAQSSIVVAGGLQERTESTLYLAVLAALCILSILVGALALALIGRAPRAGALVGLTIGAIGASEWVSAILRPFTTLSVEWAYSLSALIQWVAPVLVGIAIAWAGIDTAGRVVAAIASLVLVWVTPAVITGVTNAAGSRVLAHDPPAMVEYAAQVFQMALLMPELALRPIVATVVVAAIGLTVRWAAGRRRPAPGRTSDL